MLVEHQFHIHKSYHNPWFVEMAVTLWDADKPVIYPNENNVLVKRLFDGTTTPLINEKDEVKVKQFDKRYDEPFEDDGAYAD
jgi:hypothetical protein